MSRGPETPGREAPDFLLQLLSGGTLRRADLLGRPALLLFLRHLY